MHLTIESRDNERPIKNKWRYKEKDQNICNEKIKDGKKRKVNLLIKNKDNIEKHTHK